MHVKQRVASVLIQSKYRGHRIRSATNLQDMHNARSSMEEILAEQRAVAAAIQIERYVRGKLARVEKRRADAIIRQKRRALIVSRWQMPLR
eukprot:SAG22_NODE_19827_length_271_cov_0.604651_1_plen_90_part_11